MNDNIRRGGGVIPRPKNIRNYDYAVCGASKENIKLPESYTIPEKNIPEVHDQTWTMQCVSYALCQCAEARKKQLGEDIHFSTPWTYGRKEIRGNYDGEGLFPDVAIKGTLNLGFLELPYLDCEADVPDVLKMTADRDDLLALSQEFAPKAYYEIDYAMQEKRWESLKLALFETQRPVMIISDTFFRGGSHAVIAIGYTNEFKGVKGQYIYFQNSWGKSYKDNGRYYMPLSETDGMFVLDWEEPNFPFTDVTKNDWYYKDVMQAYFSGYVKGVSDTEFFPNDSMIRGDMAVILERIMKKQESSINAFVKTQRQFGRNVHEIKYASSSDCKTVFKDVGLDDYYKDAIYYVCANQVMHGVGDNNFNPTSSITRAEVAAIASRMIKMTASLLSDCFNKEVIIPKQDLQKYSDVSNDKWYYEAVYLAQRYGVMKGNSDNSFCPDNNITRAEGAAVLRRLTKTIENLFTQI